MALDRAVLNSAFGRGSLVSVVRVRLAEAAPFGALRSAIEGDKRLTLAAREPEVLERSSKNLRQFVRVMGVLVALCFSVTAIIAATMTMHAAIASRRRQIGVLRALGLSRSAILAGFFGEAVALTLAGGVLGAVGSVRCRR